MALTLFTQRRSHFVRLCYKKGPFVSSGQYVRGSYGIGYEERIKIMKLLWDAVGTEFGGRSPKIWRIRRPQAAVLLRCAFAIHLVCRKLLHPTAK